jgi:hypothetical protein
MVTNNNKFHNIDQGWPIGIFDGNNRILIVWSGGSATDGNGTFYCFMNLNINGNSSSISSALTNPICLTNNLVAYGSYYNLCLKPNGNIHLIFNAGYG